MPPLSILVRSTNWIGDAIMTTPALGLLKKAFPGANVSVLARPWVQAVFASNPAVSSIISLEKGCLRHRLALASRLRRDSFQLAVLFPNSFDSALVPWLSRIPLRAGYRTDARWFFLNMPVKVPAGKGKRHQVHYYCHLIEELSCRIPGADRVDAGPRPPDLFLRVPETGLAEACRLLEDAGISGDGRPLVGLNPGAAYGPAKCWPVEKYALLALKLQEMLGCHILVFGTGKERVAGAAICKSIGRYAHNFAGKTSLEQVMGLIGRLDLLVTNDSGLMHVGAALGTRLVAIFGSTNPVTTGPWSRNAVVVRHELPCSPCLKRTCSTGFKCMKDIQVEEVFDACMETLSGSNRGGGE